MFSRRRSLHSKSSCFTFMIFSKYLSSTKGTLSPSPWFPVKSVLAYGYIVYDPC